MSKSFKQALQERRSCYAINDKSPISDQQIQDIIDFALNNVPSAFNSQSTRMVLLLNDQHKKLWNGIVADTLRAIVPADAFAATEAKLASFAAGYGTVLFFEDQTVVKGLQEQFPLYAAAFPGFSHDTAAMHQLSVWTMLENEGFGATLQHYNPIIDEKVTATWGLDANWKLMAQMPFGGITERPAAPAKQPVEGKRKFFS